MVPWLVHCICLLDGAVLIIMLNINQGTLTYCCSVYWELQGNSRQHFPLQSQRPHSPLLPAQERGALRSPLPLLLRGASDVSAQLQSSFTNSSGLLVSYLALIIVDPKYTFPPSSVLNASRLCWCLHCALSGECELSQPLLHLVTVTAKGMEAKAFRK